MLIGMQRCENVICLFDKDSVSEELLVCVRVSSLIPFVVQRNQVLGECPSEFRIFSRDVQLSNEFLKNVFWGKVEE